MSETPRRNPRLGPNELHRCSFCDKAFSSFQSLGGHMTYHRKEITMLRRDHEEFMGRQRGSSSSSSASAVGQSSRAAAEDRQSLPMAPLAPNRAFWRAYREGGPRPQLVNYLRNPYDDNNITDDAAAEEANEGSGSLDLDLKL